MPGEPIYGSAVDRFGCHVEACGDLVESVGIRGPDDPDVSNGDAGRTVDFSDGIVFRLEVIVTSRPE